MTNAYGLDADYFIRLCAREFSPAVIRNQTPECLARAFARAARTACAEVLGEAEFAPKATQIAWIPMSEQWPPIGVDVLVACAGKEYPCIHTNQLGKGSDIGPRYDPELYYWQGGEDFEEVTHWAPLPAMPAVASKCDGGELEVVETLNYDALQQQCTELKAQLDEERSIGSSLLAKFDAMELRCREADNLADQWAEKNERLMAECNTLRARVERAVVRIDAFLGDNMEMPPHSLEVLKSILTGGEA